MEVRFFITNSPIHIDWTIGRSLEYNLNNEIKIIPKEVKVEQKTNETDKVQRTSYGQSTNQIYDTK